MKQGRNETVKTFEVRVLTNTWPLKLKVFNFNQNPVALAGAPFRKLFVYNGFRSTCFVHRFHARGELKERKLSNNTVRR